jgi:phosphoglycolate phosphatase
VRGQHNEPTIEVIRLRGQQRPRAVLFDYDGTLSLVRSGWRQYAIDFIAATLAALSPEASASALEALAITHVDAHTGHPSVELMAWLGSEVARRGGQPETPETYVQRAYAPLRTIVEGRLQAARDSQLPADALLVPGARRLLDLLQAQDLALWLVSGSQHSFLLRETELLGIAHYFGDHIYGPLPGGPRFTKRAVIAQLLAETGIEGAELVTFGDGAVETLEAHAVGALVVGVAYDEDKADGSRDERKRAELIRDGADLIIPDYRDADRLVAALFSALG